ncbi:MAG: leucine/isoleucine/valine transporter permease subunit [Deltaproteobacteria bacterium]|nr:leucine/isoleucine/valine transporter permease subunit [Deltaproteobacteria bacterium]MBP1716663.1 leucine/isoleucine/valine transporter permease subunit [Deltaproteobacteria bacterium]
MENENQGKPKSSKAAFLILLSAILLLVAFPFFRPPLFFLSLLISIFLFISLTESWNLLGGYTGYISLGHVVFFSIGAYTTAVCMNCFGHSPFLTAILGGAVAGGVAAIVGFPVLRLKGAYFSISSLLLAVIAQLIFLNWEFVGGSVGLWYKLMPVGIEANRVIFYEVMLGLALIITFAVRYVEKSKFGAGLITIREDEEVAKTIGINTAMLKLKAFILGSFFAGVVGGVYGYYLSFIHPDITFNVNTSLLILLMAFFGGCTTWMGPLLGAVVLSLANQLIVTFIGAEISRVLYGLILILVIIFMPNGMIEYLKAGKRVRKVQQGWKHA